MYGVDLQPAFNCAVVVFIILLGASVFFGIKSCNTKIVSDTPITPEYKLVITEGVVDTLYIYREK